MNTPNVDPIEIDKFTSLANSWWDTNGQFKPLHDINPLRLSYIAKHAVLEGKTVLDVGCGGGILTESIAGAGADVTGIDLAAASLEIAELHLLESGLSVHYEQVSAEELAESKPAAFDVVTCMEMLEHVPDPASVVQACHDLVKPGGQVFLSTLNRNPKSYLLAILGAEYILDLLPKGTHDYKRFIRPAELAGWCRAAGLALQDQCGMTYQPLTQSYQLDSHNLDVNYMVATTRID